MSLTYDHDSRLNTLAPVLDEYAGWYSQIIRQAFYAEQGAVATPGTFEAWASLASENEVRAVRRVHDDMMRIATDILSHTGEKPTAKQFDQFTMLYEEFVATIRRLERDLATEDKGLDTLTGLRSARMIARDLEREMERRSRQGRPFCLALARIDNFEQIRKLPVEMHDKAVRDFSEIVKLCVRSFDDAYRLSEGEFLMSLKQTELSGGTAALNRLRRLLVEKAPSYRLDGQDVRLSMSACVAEPQPGDTFEEMLKNMREDLSRYGDDSDTVLEYAELSPLERFVSGISRESDDKKLH